MCVCVRWGDGDTSSAKATESGLNTLGPLSLKVCQRVHGGGRPSKSTIMAFNAFHLRGEKRLRLHVLRPASQLHNVSIYGHQMPHKSTEVGEAAPATKGVKRAKSVKCCEETKAESSKTSVVYRTHKETAEICGK